MLAALLASALVIQFIPGFEGRLDPLDRSARPRDFATPTPVITAAVAADVIRERPLFSPARANAGTGEGTGPLGGSLVSGAWAVGRRMNLVLRQPDGQTRTIRVGQAVNQWVLASVTPEGARFMRDGKTMNVPFGAAAPPTAAPAEDSETEEGSE